MHRFRRILVYLEAIDSDSAALKRAVRLARKTRAHLLIVQVLPEVSLLKALRWQQPPTATDLSEARLFRLHSKIAEELVDRLRQDGLEAEARVLKGKPFLELIREAQRTGVDLILKDAQGTGPGSGGLFGSTALHLLRKAPCPVWLVKPGDDLRVRRVLAAVDCDPDNGSAVELSVDILRLASSLAAAEGAHLEILSVWWIWSEQHLTSPRFHLSASEIKSLNEAAEIEAQRRMDAVLGQIDLSQSDHSTTLRKGRPFEVIAKRAEEADLVVMGTVSRTGIPGFIVGNTAESVFHRLDTSLLAVKPRGFVSPVTADE